MLADVFENEGDTTCTRCDACLVFVCCVVSDVGVFGLCMDVTRAEGWLSCKACKLANVIGTNIGNIGGVLMVVYRET